MLPETRELWMKHWFYPAFVSTLFSFVVRRLATWRCRCVERSVQSWSSPRLIKRTRSFWRTARSLIHGRSFSTDTSKLLDQTAASSICTWVTGTCLDGLLFKFVRRCMASSIDLLANICIQRRTVRIKTYVARSKILIETIANIFTWFMLFCDFLAHITRLQSH